MAALFMMATCAMAEPVTLRCEIATETKIAEFLEKNSLQTTRFANACRDSEYGLRRDITFDTRGYVNPDYKNAKSYGSWCWGDGELVNELELSATPSIISFHYKEDAFDFNIDRESYFGISPNKSAKWQCKVKNQ
tara:strand:+ start:111 stop:515 length:405 start_codon:yes stop_codon:yes gene_type:complete